MDYEEIIGFRIVNGIRFNTERISLVNHEFKEQPIHLLLPNPYFQIDFEYLSLKIIFEKIINYLDKNFYLRNEMDF